MGTYLHRFNVKPRHLDEYLPLWRAEVGLMRGYGFVMRQAYLETHAEPKLTWLYSHPEFHNALAALRVDEAWRRLDEKVAPHVFRNLVVRPVTPRLPLGITPTAGRTVCLRRYSIVGDWQAFLAIWDQIVELREKHGFRCLFAVSDEPLDLFTWAFEFDGAWDDFDPLQREYYRDPERMALRGVFDYMADYTIAPASSLIFPRSRRNLLGGEPQAG